jgi:hypothetical protein
LRLGWVLQRRSKIPYQSSREGGPAPSVANGVSPYVPVRKNGTSDPWFSFLDTLGDYERMAEDNGGMEKVQGWSRFFLVPGMSHCGGGQAALDEFDFLSAVADWVEKGRIP